MKIVITENQLETLIKRNRETTNNVVEYVPRVREHVFELCTTVNGRYIILNDTVFDIQEQKDLGYIWDSLDTFKTIFKNTDLEEKEYKEIQESIINLPILESDEKTYLRQMRNVLLEFDLLGSIKSGINDFGGWIADAAKETVGGVSNFIAQSYEGLKEFGVAISKGEWSEILNLMWKGTLFIIRKLKDALYSTTGMIVDAILVATGIGKGAQMLAWGLVLALDIYQLISGDWPEEEKNKPLWAKWLDIGFDTLGFAFAGASAKIAKSIFKPISGAKSSAQAAEFVTKTPAAKSILEKILGTSREVPTKMARVSETLSKKYPAGAKFIGNISGRISGAMKSMNESLGKLLGRKGAESGVRSTSKLAKGTKAGLTTTGLLYGFHKVFGGGKESGIKGDAGMEDLGAEIGTNYIKPDYSEIDI